MNAKNFFVNLAIILILYILIFSFFSVIFNIIDYKFKSKNIEYYFSPKSIEISIIIVFSPLLIFLIYFLNNLYNKNPEIKNSKIRIWLMHLTIFLSSSAIIIDTIMVLFYFLDGKDITINFISKTLSIFVFSLLIFSYFILNIKEKITSKINKIFMAIFILIITTTILTHFLIFGGPKTQQKLKSDEQKINNLVFVSDTINYFYEQNSFIPKTENIEKEMPNLFNFLKENNIEYKKIDDVNFNLCTFFNFDSKNNLKPYYQNYYQIDWSHPAGNYCFKIKITIPATPPKPVPLPAPVNN